TLDVTGLTGGTRFGGTSNSTPLMNVQGGDTVDGTGTINGGLKVKSGGTVYPGDNGDGALSVKGDADFAGGSTWKVKLPTSTPGTGNSIAFISNGNSNPLSLTLGESGNNMIMPIDGNGQTFTAGQTYDYVIATNTSTAVNGVTFQPSNFVPAAFASPAFFSL